MRGTGSARAQSASFNFANNLICVVGARKIFLTAAATLLSASAPGLGWGNRSRGRAIAYGGSGFGTAAPRAPPSRPLAGRVDASRSEASGWGDYANCDVAVMSRADQTPRWHTWPDAQGQHQSLRRSLRQPRGDGRTLSSRSPPTRRRYASPRSPPTGGRVGACGCVVKYRPCSSATTARRTTASRRAIAYGGRVIAAHGQPR
jgi:hypothetical protein